MPFTTIEQFDGVHPMTRERISSCRSVLSCARRAGFAAALLLAVFGCGADSGSQRADEPAGDTAQAAQPASAASAPSGAIDRELAAQGESLFQAKGCNGCHTVGGGRLTGPDLAGVTERREYGWMMAMITKPDSMIKADPTARQLFAEYMTPMLNMGVTPEEARAIYEYLRDETGDGS